MTAALRIGDLVAATPFDGASNGRRCGSAVTATSVPVRRRGDIVVRDGLQSRSVAGMRDAIAAACTRIVRLPA